MGQHLVRGLIAGAAGTTALNAATYLDMLVRARAASSTPEQTVERAQALLGVEPSAEGTESNRRSGAAALLGIVTGLSSGAGYGLLRARYPHAPLPLFVLIAAGLANLGSVLPMSALGSTDPREWSAASWASDLLPHLAYGAVTAIAFDLRSSG